MKIQFTKEKSKQEPEFPALYEFLNDGDKPLTVLFFSERSGIVIQTSGGSEKEGVFTSNWKTCEDTSLWTRINGSINFNV